jgi:hypothetical protein
MVMPVPSTVAPTDMLLLRSSSHDYGYSQYNQRARVEGQIARWKQVIGDGLRFHSDEATEVAIATAVLNQMLHLGRPNSVRVA